MNPANATWTFATSQNTTLVCGTIRILVTYAGVDGRVMLQLAAFSPFGSDVLPGRRVTVR